MEHNEGSFENLCACGCGLKTQKARNGRCNKFILGHNAKHSKTNPASKNGNAGQFQPGNPIIRRKLSLRTLLH